MLRDALGNVVCAESIFLGRAKATVLYAEASALWKGQQVCAHLGITNFDVETDSKLLCLFLNDQTPWPWDIYHLLFQSKSLLSQLHASLRHIYREANMVADLLATAATTSKLSFSYDLRTLRPGSSGISIPLCRSL